MFPQTRIRLFLISAAIILIVAPLIQNGIFIDGLLYKTVAYNYSQGEGSFWKMKFTDVSMNPFYEQPPLYFFTQGLWFKIFGSSLAFDRLFTLTLIFVTLFLLKKISNNLFPGNRALFHILILFLLSVQVLCWSYVNQMIETLVLLLSLFCLFLFQKGIQSQIKYALGFSLSFGITVGLLFLAKGFQSCFIGALPFFYLIFFRSKKSFIFFLVATVTSITLLWIILFNHTPSSEWFSHYLQKRLLASLNNVGATTDNHFEIIFRIFSEMVVPLVLIAVLFFKFRVLKVNRDKNSFVLILTAIAGSFPFAITLEQRGFYLVPSFPFYLLGLIMLFRDHLNFFYSGLNDFFSRRFIIPVIYVIFTASLVYLAFSFTLFKRDENLIRDLVIIEKHIPSRDTVSIADETWNNVPLHGYLYMHRKTNLEVSLKHPYLIRDRTISGKPDSIYQKLELKTLQYDLYKRRQNRP